MATNLGFVTHTTKTDTHEIAAQSCGNGAPHTGFTGTWGTDKAQDGAARFVGSHLPHGNVFQDALLGFGQAIMVLIEHLRGVSHIQVVIRGLAPGKVQ